MTWKRYTIEFKFSCYSKEGVYSQYLVIAWFSFSRLKSSTRMGFIMNTGLVTYKVKFSDSESVIEYLYPMVLVLEHAWSREYVGVGSQGSTPNLTPYFL